MITLNDALNRNYYFYQSSGDVQVDFLRQVNDTFLGYDFNSFIGDKANYWMSKKMSRSDAFRKAYHQGVEMAMRACAAIPKYRTEIKKKFAEQPGLRGGITDEQIDHMKYTELSTLRTNLGLSRKGKKVVKQETAPKKTIEQAKKVVREEPVAKTAAKVIEATQLSLQDYYPDAFRPEPHHEIEEFYTPEEARQAYPGYSYEELEETGVHLIGPNAREKLEYLDFIDKILKFQITIHGEEITSDTLANCSKDELLRIYDAIRTLNRVNKKSRSK